jgi:hypothetical protein
LATFGVAKRRSSKDIDMLWVLVACAWNAFEVSLGP